ncbi:carotenoid oxygenase family protein [Planomonospora venezuelensis]|uniref:Dioxygenase n=1 Tax=Planomonospora venezuelensis TaxID=1999 RepID=A0A841D9L8_PLAVE|nr:carotenoid oxygenase family protein [Planomonospora venezuelensis]MBB5965543.1 carotenoid cleavage dioxygenase [Planomonospora venezuelensis]GIN03028.1 retinal pigment epithelial membrane protein [Planomonospora venezuelensis]
MTPAYLQGHYAPVADEISAVGLPVTGELPAELSGRYFRNGPNPLPGQDPGHWFLGHGMLHGIRLRDGRAEWYRNRWTRTTLFTDGAPFIGDAGVDLAAVSANTSVVRHGGRILALVENGLPYEVGPGLETVGPCDFGGRLATAMTAHPKQDPVTGELLFFGYGFAPPYLTYHRLSAAGELVESREIEVPGPTMMHDFAITENHVVWLDLPVVFDLEGALRGIPYRWDDAYGARLGVMRRDGGDGERVRWHEIDPCYVFHVGNAHEDAEGQVVLDAVRYSPGSFAQAWEAIGGAADPAVAAASAAAIGGATLHRWTLGATAKQEQLDDLGIEFPSLNGERTGLANRYLYAVTGDAVVKYDTVTGASLVRAAGGPAGEAVFVPAEGARSEDDGWLMSIVGAGDGSELRVLEAGSLEQVAAVRLPRRVPAGFHGGWFADDR